MSGNGDAGAGDTTAVPNVPNASAKTKYESDLVVVLDLDQCLIDSHLSYETESTERFMERLLGKNWQREKWINQDLEHWRFQVTDEIEAYVTPRPGVNEFLRKVSAKFETHAFTSAHEVYAGKVLDRLDPDGSMLAGRWFNEYTVTMGDNRVKDLTLLFPDRDLGRVVLVDDNTGSMLSSPANGIPIPGYMGLDPNDDELDKVWHLLLELDTVPDVRPVLDEKFGVAKDWESYIVMFGGEIESMLQWKRERLREMEEEEKDPKKKRRG
jgi:Dullard-like phosphatase family protein